MLQVDVKKHLGKKGSDGFQLDLSFTADNGITVLTGASGSGKTTLLNLIAGIVRPDEGFIKLDGRTFFDSKENINMPIQKRRVGFVFQDYALFPNMTAEQNSDYGMSVQKPHKVSGWLGLFHIGHVRHRYPHEMSGGEQQRVAIARALGSDPLLMLLDEPLSAVDIETRAKLLDEIETAQRQKDIPFIYVTHNIEEADRLGARRITLKGGKIADSAL
jgi:molybdate transport system ATP-binding protein